MNAAAAARLAQLEAVRVASSIPDRGVVCISVMRNEMLRLPDFLRHYRELGVARFVIVDNASGDGTGEFLAEQPDVDLWRTGEPYSSPSRREWLNALAHHTAEGRWCLIVDADEHLVYDGCDRHDLNDLIELLDRKGMQALPCLLLDMYGDGPMKDATVGGSERLVDVCGYFDRRGYEATERVTRRLVTGGPRQRLLSTPDEPFVCDLSKTPLAKWSAEAALISSHQLYPPEYNLAPLTGCLLHFKFLADFHARVVEAVEKEQYWQQSREYKRYAELLAADPDLTMMFADSERFRGAESLVEAGLITELWRDEPPGT